MARSFVSARDQFAMAAPWGVHEALDVRPDARRPGRGVPVTPAPAGPAQNMGDPDAPWARHDWHESAANGTYGAFRNPARPPMSSDVPHPSELLHPTRHSKPRMEVMEDDNGKKVKVERPSWNEMAANSSDPDNDPYGLLSGAPGDTFRDHVDRFKQRISRGRQDPNNDGLLWYAAAHDRAKDVAGKSHGDIERVVGNDAALSPVKDWDLNTEQSTHVNMQYPGTRPGDGVGPVDDPYHPDPTQRQKATGPGNEDPTNWRVPAPDAQNLKVRQIMDLPPGATREDIVNILNGPKTHSFMNNIIDSTQLREPRGGDPEDVGFYHHQINPHTGQPDFRYGDQDVTADTHHVRAHTYGTDTDVSKVGYQTPPWFQEKMKVGGKAYYPGYDLSARIAAQANAELNHEEPDHLRHMLPKQGQALGWMDWKSQQAQQGGGAGFVEPGTPPKSWNPNKRKRDPESGEMQLDPNQGLSPLTNNGRPDLPHAPRYHRDHGDFDPESGRGFFVHPMRPQMGPLLDENGDRNIGTNGVPTQNLDMMRNRGRKRSMVDEDYDFSYSAHMAAYEAPVHSVQDTLSMVADLLK